MKEISLDHGISTVTTLNERGKFRPRDISNYVHELKLLYEYNEDDFRFKFLISTKLQHG